MRNGIRLDTDRFSISGYRNRNGEIIVDSREEAAIPGLVDRIDYFLNHVPVIGSVILSLAITLLFATIGLTLEKIAGSIGMNDRSIVIAQLLIIGTLTIIVAPHTRQRFQFHSVEHKVINCLADNRNPKLTMDALKKADYFSPLCGSLVSKYIIVYLVILLLFPPQSPISACFIIFMIITIGFEMRRLVASGRHPTLFKIERFLQKGVCWTPSDSQLEIGLAVARRLRKLHRSVDRQPIQGA